MPATYIIMLKNIFSLTVYCIDTIHCNLTPYLNISVKFKIKIEFNNDHTPLVCMFFA